MRCNINPDEIFRHFFGNMNIHSQMQQQQFQNINNDTGSHQLHQLHRVHHVFMGNNNVQTQTMVIIQNGQRIEITRQI